MTFPMVCAIARTTAAHEMRLFWFVMAVVAVVGAAYAAFIFAFGPTARPAVIRTGLDSRVPIRSRFFAFTDCCRGSWWSGEAFLAD